MRVAWRPRAEKDLQKLPLTAQHRIVEAIDRFAATGHGDVKKLAGADPPEWRLRVGDYRVRFEIDKASDTLYVLRVLPRGDAYR
ncbi:MAG: type II toxin-antitoxin system RelE/ParE family toxin [Gemmatimonadetes bacterium]|nr:type II toxin-antitoxin system RelE/ParE family toxin [Gemmatimonadota bacterium]